MIPEDKEKINPVVNFGNVPMAPDGVFAKIYYRVKPFYFLILSLILASIFFALGRLYTLNQEKEPIKVVYEQAALVISSTASSSGKTATSSVPTVKTDGEVVGSKSGKKYYFPWCGTVKRIKPENQVHFASIEEAKKAGFTPGGNCKGLW